MPSFARNVSRPSLSSECRDVNRLACCQVGHVSLVKTSVPPQAATPRTRLRWYAVSALFVMRQRVPRQRTFTVFENVYLVQLRHRTEASQHLTSVIAAETTVDSSLRVNGRPASIEFLTIRKVTSCALPVEHDQGDAEAVVRIVSGVEATYSIFRVHGARALKRLSRGDEVEVVYES